MFSNVMRYKNAIGDSSLSARTAWIDVMRGIAIILVVLGHSIGTLSDPLNRFILSFHMPLFFFISGLTAKTRDSNGNMIKPKIYLAKKIKSLIVPQITFFVYCTIFDVLSNRRILNINLIIGNLFAWFLPVLFYVSVVFWLLDRFNLIKYKSICLVVTFIIASLTQIVHLNTAVKIEIVPMALLFYLIGFYMKPWIVTRKIKSERLELIRPLWVLAIPITVICSYWNTPVTMYSNNYGNLLLFFICSITSIWSVYEISIGLHNNRLLQWFGTNSIIIYIFHSRLLNILHGIGKAIFPKLVGENNSYPAYWHYFFITLVLMMPIAYCCNKWIPMLFGKKSKSPII